MKKLIVAAGAVSLALGSWAASQTNDWFDADIGGYSAWPTNNATLFGGAWSANAADVAELSGTAPAAALQVDADTDDPLEFTAANAKTLGSGSEALFYTADVSFTPFATLPTEVPADAKGGIVLCGSASPYHFAVLARDGANNSNVWVATTLDVTDKDAAHTVSITVTQDKKITYAIGGTALSDGTTSAFDIYLADSAKTFSKVSVSGYGTVGALAAAADETLNALTIADLSARHLTVGSVTADGVAVEGDAGVYLIPYGADVVITFVPEKGYAQSGAGMTLALDDFTAATTVNSSTENLPTVAEAGATFGGQDFLTLNAALAAVKATDANPVVTLLKDETATAGFATNTAFNNLTIELGGHTYTYDCPDRLRFFQGAMVTIRNGTLARSESTKWSDLLRTYATSLTVSNVVLDCANVTNGAAIIYTDGDLKLVGSTAISNCTVKALDMGNYAGTSYAMGTLTIDTTAEITGDFIFAGGTVDIRTPDALNASSHFYYGSKPYTAYADTNILNGTFVARTGAIPAATGKDGPEPIGGELFKTFDGALSAATNGDTVTVFHDIGGVYVTIDKKITLDATGYTVTGVVSNYAINIMGGDVTIAGGTFKAEDTTSNSLFLIGQWDEKNTGTVTAYTGKLTVNGGTLGGLKAGNLIKCAKGDVVVNAGTLDISGARGIKADGPDATITVNGGTINAEGKRALCVDQGGQIVYNDGTITGNIVYEGSNASSLITVNGGKITGTVGPYGSATGGTVLLPSTSTAWFSTDQTKYCQTGYATVLDTGDNWYKVTLRTYTVTYKNANGTAFTAWQDGYTAPSSFTMESEAFTLPVADNVTLSTGYESFIGWKNADGDAVASVAKGTTEDVVVYANWNCTAYTITYLMPDGTTPFASWAATYTVTNSFTVESDTIMLPGAAEMNLTGGTFNSWTNAAGATVTQIASGTTANVTVIADMTTGPVIDPTKGETTNTVSATSEADATNQVITAIVSPDETVVPTATYQSYFTATATPKGDGSYEVTLSLDTNVVQVTESLEDTATAANMATLIAGEDETTVSITDAKPGLWYSFKYTTSLAADAEDWGEGKRTQATSAGCAVEVPAKGAGETVKFWKLNVDTVDKAE